MSSQATRVQILEGVIRSTGWKGLIVDSKDNIILDNMMDPCTEDTRQAISKMKHSQHNFRIQNTWWNIQCTFIDPHDVRKLTTEFLSESKNSGRSISDN